MSPKCACLKAICKMKGWTYTEKDNIGRLIQIVFDKELIQNTGGL